MRFETLHSALIFTGRVFALRQDQVRLPDGKQISLDVVVHRGAAVLLPVDEQGRLWMVRQYRHAVQRDLLELPAGTLDAGEDPLTCAHREIREEIGMSADRIESIGGFFPAPGYSTEYLYIYLASGLKPGALETDADEFLSVEQIPVAQVYQMAESGQIDDAKTLAALLLARPHLVERGFIN